jgi:lipopolysaccharide transport system permease protein
MQSFSSSPAALISNAWRHRELLAALSRRDVVGRYRGSFMGLAWSFLHPLVMLAVYTFVFGFVFRARWDAGSGSTAEFALVLFAGLLVYNVFAECANRAPTLVVGNPSYVKKVVFPLEVLPYVTLGAALFHLAIGLVVWVIFYALLIGTPPVTIAWLPVVLLPLALLSLGVSWFLAALGVYLRDVAHVIGVATTALLFVTPVFYPLSALPPEWQRWMRLNPLTDVVESARGVLIWGRSPDWSHYGVSLAVAAAIAWLGYAWFQKTRRGFADVL